MSTLYRARVVRMDAEGVFVEIPDLGEGTEWGPVEMAPVPLALNDGVIVGSINDILEDLALVAKLVTVALPGNQLQAYVYENAIARLAAGVTAVSGMLTWLDDEQRLEIFTDEGTPGWVEFYGFRSNQLILPDTHKIGFGNGFPSARVDFTSEMSWFPILGSNVEADSEKRWSVDADGNTQWGPGNAALDAGLRRTASGRLRVSNQLGVGGDPASTASVTAEQSTNRAGFFSKNTEATTHTNPHFYALEQSSLASRLTEAWMVGDSDPRFRIYMDGELNWGSGAGIIDCYLWRQNTNLLGMDADLNLYGDIDAFEVMVGSKPLPRGIVVYEEITSSTSAIGTTPGAVITLPSFTYKANRLYKAVMSLGFTVSNAGMLADWRVYKTNTSTQVTELFRTHGPTTGVVHAAHGSRMFKVGGSDVTATLLLGVAASANTVTGFGSSGSPGTFWIEDMGNVGNIGVTVSNTLS